MSLTISAPGHTEWNAVTAGLNNGGFVVVWNGWNGGPELRGRCFSATGAHVGSEFVVSRTPWREFYSDASVARLNNGDFVIAWHTDLRDAYHNYIGDGIHGQRYSGTCTPIGSRFTAVARGALFNINFGVPSVAGLANGGSVIVWNSLRQDGSDFGVSGQRYDAMGVAVSGNFQVNSYTNGYQGKPSLAALSNGGFVVIWQSDAQDGSNWGIYGQRYSVMGAPVGGEFRINTFRQGAQLQPSVVGLTDGGFVATWTSTGQDGSADGIFGRRYNAAGGPITGEFRVNTFTQGKQNDPSVAGLNNSGFVVVWESKSQDGIYGQRFQPDVD